MESSNQFSDRIFKHFSIYWPVYLLISYISLFYISYTNLPISDLGRHITNGRIVLATAFGEFAGFDGNTFELSKLFTQNFYSYSQPNHEFMNHHWLFGVFAALLHKIGGFELLTLSNVCIYMLGFSFMLLSSIQNFSKKKYGVIVTTLSAFSLLPLFVSRTEVRPEALSFCFFALFWYVFSYIDRKTELQKAYQTLFILVPIQIIWVNSHLFYILGPLLAGYFLVKNLLEKNSTRIFWIVCLFSLLLAATINPHGLRLLLEPFLILTDYGYSVAENKSTWFLFNFGLSIHYYAYVIFTGILTILLSSYYFYKKPSYANMLGLLITTAFTVVANSVSRFTPFMAIILLPFLSQYLWFVYKKINPNILKQYSQFITSGVVFLLFGLIATGIFTPNFYQIGVGLFPNNLQAAHFFEENNLKGPIFNNYDVGGYIIFNHFPKEKVFIDNRPEAYPVSFLQNAVAVYDDQTVWENLDKQHNFNVLYLHKNDLIDNAQNFFYERSQDPEWVPIYVDNTIIILVRNSEQNSEIITQHAIEKSFFQIIQRQ